VTLRLSNSEMKQWRRCRRQWYYSTYKRLGKIVEEEPGGSLSIGNLVHDALALYYEPLPPRKRKRPDPVAFIEQVAAAKLERMPALEKAILSEKELCVAMVVGYLEWLEETGADQALRVEGSERTVEVPLKVEEPGITLISKLDAPVTRESDGMRLALEHKTVQTLEQNMPLLKLDTQLLTEHLARFLHSIEEGATPEEAMQQCHGILYNMLRKVKRTARAQPPFYGREDVPHNIIELRNHWRHVVAIGREIQAATAALDAGADHHVVCPPNPTRDCSWDCAFLPVCVMNDDGSDIEGALAAMYVERNPLARYENALALSSEAGMEGEGGG